MGPGIEIEPGSFIIYAIERSIRQEPEQAAAEMLQLIRSEAALQAENALLKAELEGLGRLMADEKLYGFR